MTKTIHIHQNYAYKKSTVLLLLVPTIVYVFIIGFYLVTTGLTAYPDQASNGNSDTATSYTTSTSVLGETNVDK